MENRRRVLALSGKRFAGKDTFYSALAAASNEKLQRYAFADQAKHSFVRHWNASHAQPEAQVNLLLLLTDRSYKETWRSHLTAYVTDALAKDPIVFCREIIDAAQQTPPTHAIVITDLRLKVELAELQKHFHVHVLRIERSAVDKRASGWVPSLQVDAHYTETDLDEPSLWTTVVNNDSTLAALASHSQSLINTCSALH